MINYCRFLLEESSKLKKKKKQRKMEMKFIFFKFIVMKNIKELKLQLDKIINKNKTKRKLEYIFSLNFSIITQEQRE